MKQKARLWWIIGAVLVVMALLPHVVFPIIPPKSGFFVALMLSMIVNPLVSVWIGIVAGKEVRRYWFTPLWIVAAYCGGMFILDSSIPSWPLPLAYFVLSAAAMFITHMIVRRK